MLVCEVCGKTVIPGKDFSPTVFLLQLSGWTALGAFIGATIGFVIVTAETAESAAYLYEVDRSIVRDLTWIFAAAFGIIGAFILTLSNLAKPPTLCPFKDRWDRKHEVYQKKVFEQDTTPEGKTYD